MRHCRGLVAFYPPQPVIEIPCVLARSQDNDDLLCDPLGELNLEAYAASLEQTLRDDKGVDLKVTPHMRAHAQLVKH